MAKSNCKIAKIMEKLKDLEIMKEKKTNAKYFCVNISAPLFHLEPWCKMF